MRKTSGSQGESYVSDRKLCDIQGYIHIETEKAILFSEHDDIDEAAWLPKSQIEIEKTERGAIVNITMPEWLAKDKELI
jgi:hypothetical protein